MNNLVVLPILLPLITGVLALLFFRKINIQRIISVIGLLFTATGLNDTHYAGSSDWSSNA